MVRAGPLAPSRMAVGSIYAFIDVALGTGPKALDAVEVTAKRCGRAIDQRRWEAEVVAEWISWRAAG